MKEIRLTGGQIAIVDDEDYQEISRYIWTITKGGYAQRNSEQVNLVRHHYSMHRQIMGFPEGKNVDHINGNKLDNRRENLRIATVAQNAFNRGMQRNNSSGFKGVYFNYKKYSARITANRVVYRLGSFNTPEEAYDAYCKKAIELHGEFVNLGKGESNVNR